MIPVLAGYVTLVQGVNVKTALMIGDSGQNTGQFPSWAEDKYSKSLMIVTVNLCVARDVATRYVKLN